MDLYLVRHGIAVDIGEQGVETDSARMLSDEGRKRTRQVAQALNRLGCSPQQIVTSPLVRARETAEIIRDELAPAAPVVEREELAPGAGVEQVINWLAAEMDSSVMLVGHMPGVEDLAAALLTQDGALRITFKKASVCLISFEGAPRRGDGTLGWLVQPKQLRPLAK